MTNVNIIFDNLLDDADIIAVPDEIAFEIEELGQRFLHWIPHSEDKEYWTTINGQKCAVAETDGFIKWLNSYYFSDEGRAYVVARNTGYCPQYRIVEF